MMRNVLWVSMKPQILLRGLFVGLLTDHTVGLLWVKINLRNALMLKEGHLEISGQYNLYLLHYLLSNLFYLDDVLHD